MESIAIPSFNSAREKAKQKEAAVLISSYIKAAQSYFIEYGVPLTGVGDLANYMNVIECTYHLRSRCKNEDVRRNIGVSCPESRVWNSPSGGFSINMSNSNNNKFLMRALPQAQTWPAMELANDAYGVSGCFNYSSGASKVNLMRERGHQNVVDIDC